MSLCIEVSHLSKNYKDTLTIIEDLSLKVNEGEIVVFQGPSGIGKSTFLRCLTYLEPFQEGTVKIGNIQLQANMDERKHRYTIQSVRKQVGFVFQFFNLFPHLTVLDNLTIAPIKVLGQTLTQAQQEAYKLLNRVGLEHKAKTYPATLSGGQKQRVAIARALAMHPKCLLLDEPTSSLDPEMKEEVVKVIEEFSHEGLTMLIVTHEPKFVENVATRIIKFGPHCKIESDHHRRK